RSPRSWPFSTVSRRVRTDDTSSRPRRLSTTRTRTATATRRAAPAPDLRAAPRDEVAKRLELLASPPALRAPAPQVPPALHGLLVHAQLAGDPLHPLAPLEPGQNLPHHVLLHHRPLRRSRWDRRRRYGKRLLLHTVPSSLGGGGNFRRRLRGEFYATDDTRDREGRGRTHGKC